MRTKLTAPPLAWVDDLASGACREFHVASISYGEGDLGVPDADPLCLPPRVTICLGDDLALSLTFPVIEALARLAAKQDGIDAAELTSLPGGDVLAAGRRHPTTLAELRLIVGGRA